MAKRQLVGRPKNNAISFEDRKAEVLTMAARLFNEVGYHKTTMGNIADAMGVSKPALYYYAKSKDEFLFEIVTRALDDLQAALADAKQEGANGAEILQRFFTSWAEISCSDFGRCMVMTPVSDLEPGTGQRFRTVRRKIRRDVMAVIESGVEDGSVRACDTDLLGRVLFDLFNGISAWVTRSKGRKPREVAEFYWDVLTRGVFS